VTIHFKLNINCCFGFNTIGISINCFPLRFIIKDKTGRNLQTKFKNIRIGAFCVRRLKSRNALNIALSAIVCLPCFINLLMNFFIHFEL